MDTLAQHLAGQTVAGFLLCAIPIGIIIVAYCCCVISGRADQHLE